MSTLSAQQRAALVMKARAQKVEAAIVAASADAMAQLVAEEGGVKGTKRKNQEESSRVSLEIPKKKKVISVEKEEEEVDDEPLRFKRMPRSKGLMPPKFGEGGSNLVNQGKGKKSNLSASLLTNDFDSFSVINESFQKYARTSSLSDLDFEDLRQAAMDHHVQGTMLSYYLFTRQELDSIAARNKMESANTSLSALEKEYVAAKSKFEEDLAAAKAGQEEAVKVVVKAKDDEVVSLKGESEVFGGRACCGDQREIRGNPEGDTLTARVENLELEVVSKYDDGFKFAIDQIKVVFPDLDTIKLGELDSLNQIVDGKLGSLCSSCF
ncbi:hypothetical protein TSUD_290030 [Trifolium subterraneum]|uniref:Uncharacterized protein n=1 Tax=Trifolium subterraneum TaxID=3900 RepID=A0A2Z6P9L1_TRISU|nr:hypothetical protein TSUD_290030 [Trifolium subterraneum]